MILFQKTAIFGFRKHLFPVNKEIERYYVSEAYNFMGFFIMVVCLLYKKLKQK